VDQSEPAKGRPDMPAVLQPMSVEKLFEELKIPAFRIVTEITSSITFFTMEKAQAILQTGVEEGVLTSDEASAFETEMKEKGILSNTAELFDRVYAVDVSDCDMHDLAFEVCTSCPFPLPHGYICKSGEEIGTAMELVDGFVSLVRLFEEDKCSFVQAANLFQQMRAAEIPDDEDDRNRKYNELPKEVRAEYELWREQQKHEKLSRLGVRRVSSFELLDGTQMDVIDIDMISLLENALVDIFGNPVSSEQKSDEKNDSEEG